jgi:hypothetical protein
VGLIFRLLELLLVLVPLVGAIVAITKGISAVRGRDDGTRAPTHEAIPASQPQPNTAASQAAQWRTITRVLDEHRRTDDRWLSYEVDVAKLLDFPLITDMREPLTTRFHGAKFRADLLRPRVAEDLLDDWDVAREYLDAVEQYVTTFNAAEAEAIRRRRSSFSQSDQQRLARAQSLLRVALDPSATAQERGQAYALATKELDGLLVLPDRTRLAIERGVAGEIDG